MTDPSARTSGRQWLGFALLGLVVTAAVVGTALAAISVLFLRSCGGCGG
ncbi:MAG TPA: hypothetical protein VD763_14060 [Candidatus Saccharimonadales bacterium]|nr:hypothetical protein [Candidatus Saccharimonadales bacterium]